MNVSEASFILRSLVVDDVVSCVERSSQEYSGVSSFLAGSYFANAFGLFAVIIGAVEQVFDFEVEVLSGLAEPVV